MYRYLPTPKKDMYAVYHRPGLDSTMSPVHEDSGKQNACT